MEKKELVSTVLLTPPILRKVSQVSHRVLLTGVEIYDTFQRYSRSLSVFVVVVVVCFHGSSTTFETGLIHSFIHSFILFAIYTKFTTQNGNNMRLKKK